MWRVLAISVCIASIPGAAHAQAAIAGTVRDAFGSPIPGVTIEAGSSALIERTRTAIADDAGRYRIEDLRPGIYQVRFSLQGWKSYQREGIELTGTFTATVDAELSIGGVTETVTVIGESPAVDIQSVRHEITLTGELVRSIPTVRSYNALVVLVPGVVTNVNDTVTGTATTSFPMYGGRTNEGRLSLDARLRRQPLVAPRH